MSDNGATRPDVCVVGLGYIGLPTAAVMAAAGLRVHGVDVKKDAVDTINQGRIHIEEPGLEDLVRQGVTRGQLTAALEPVAAPVYLIAVPTPFHDDKSPDISFVLSAARAIAPHLSAGDLVVVESTSPVGTTEQVRDAVLAARPDLADGALHFAYCPERVLPGRIIEELEANDRCVGGLEPEGTAIAQRFYKQFVKGDCVGTHARVAEMVKLVENSSRDVQIAFANELSLIAARMDIDVWEVIALANRHPRVNILQPGPGVGGHCIAVDPWFIVSSAPEEARLIRTAREVNDAKPDYVLGRAEALLDAHPGEKLACLGLAFKPDIDDLRESPALQIAAELARRHGDRIVCIEPHITELPKSIAGTGASLLGWDEALAECRLGLLLVDHTAFKQRGPVSPFAAHYDSRGLWRAGTGGG